MPPRSAPDDIDNDDPVRLLSAILEEMDFSNLLQVFPNKTKVHPVNMFAVIKIGRAHV